MKLQIVVYGSTSGGENLMHKQRVSRLRLIRFCSANIFAAAAFWIFHEARSTVMKMLLLFFPWLKMQLPLKRFVKRIYERSLLQQKSSKFCSCFCSLGKCGAVLVNNWLVRLSAKRKKSNELLIFTWKNVKKLPRCKIIASYPKINIKMNMRHLHKSSICCFSFSTLLLFFYDALVGFTHSWQVLNMCRRTPSCILWTLVNREIWWDLFGSYDTLRRFLTLILNFI